MVDAIMTMPSFTPSLEYTNTQPNLFDSGNLKPFLDDLKNKEYYSLLLFVIIVDTVEYKHIVSSESMISLVCPLVITSFTSVFITTNLQSL